MFVIAASLATLAVNQWTNLFALPGLPHYFALFAWGSTFGGFALVVVYLLMCVGSLRSFAAAPGRGALVVAALIGIVITAGAIFASFYKVQKPTIWAPWARGRAVRGGAADHPGAARPAGSPPRTG